MRHEPNRIVRAAVALLCATVLAPAMAADDDVAQLRRDVAELKALVQQLSSRVAQQDEQIRALQSGAAPASAQATAEAPATPAPPPVTSEAPPSSGAVQAGRGSNFFNPSISLIGNFLGVAGNNRTENAPGMALRESELGLSAIVDPYARADVFLSFGEQGVDVEEGFVTFTSLPAGLLARVGRMRAAFGKINTLHLHVLPWPDEPLPVANLLGPDGWIGTGVSVGRLLPLGDTFSELTLQAFRGDAEDLFASDGRRDLAYNAHYRVFRDITESVNVDLGASWAQGPNGTSPDNRTRLDGLDATVRWKPLVTGSYRSATLRGELVRSRREQPGGDQRARGWFVSGEYQLAKRWFAGARLEASDHPDDSARTDRGKAVLLTFWPSEFSQLRAELRRRVYFDRTTANELLLQLQFAIGAHGAHPF